MPRLTKTLPSYRHHRGSGQAIVTLSGQDFYLGAHGTKASKAEYDRLVAEWLANNRQVPRAVAGAIPLTVSELIVDYMRFARSYYQKNGKPTSEVAGMEHCLKFVRRHYARLPASEFSPLKLKTIVHSMVEAGLSRSTVNHHRSRITRVFKWAVANERVSESVFSALRSVDGLRSGRTEAKDADPVRPVSDAVVEATLPHLPAVVADMVRLQRLTGMRPAEVCGVRPADVDTSGKIWRYVPASHKTQHHGKERAIFIGPRGQDILRPYLLRAHDAFCFSPEDSEKKRRTEAGLRRIIPLHYGNSPGTNKRKKPARQPGDHYTSPSYRRAIARACDLQWPEPEHLRRRKSEDASQRYKRLTDKERAELRQWWKIHHWNPNQLRHTAATEIRKHFGLEAAQVVLGHAAANMTQVYAERDSAKAAAVAEAVG